MTARGHSTTYRHGPGPPGHLSPPIGAPQLDAERIASTRKCFRPESCLECPKCKSWLRRLRLNMNRVHLRALGSILHKGGWPLVFAGKKAEKVMIAWRVCGKWAIAMTPIAAAFVLVPTGNPLVVRIQDQCDPATFNATFGPGTCTGSGQTTFDHFIGEVTNAQKAG